MSPPNPRMTRGERVLARHRDNVRASLRDWTQAWLTEDLGDRYDHASVMVAYLRRQAESIERSRAEMSGEEETT